jgi:Holliday junction resolvase
MRKQTNYERGRSVEYAVIKTLRSKGCYCIRAYGSKGIFDVIACPPITSKDPRTLLIQVKVREELLTKIEKESLIEVGRTLAGRVLLSYKDEKGHVRFKEFV